MAKTPKSRSVKSGPRAKKQVKAGKRKAPAKASGKAVKASPTKSAARKSAPKAAAKPAKRPKPQKQVTERSAMPEHAASVAAARRAVARPTKAHHEAQMEQAEHDHQDPRLAGIPGVAHEGKKVQPENFGQFKTKAVARMDKPVNWFRRAPKPKQ